MIYFKQHNCFLIGGIMLLLEINLINSIIYAKTIHNNISLLKTSNNYLFKNELIHNDYYTNDDYKDAGRYNNIHKANKSKKNAIRNVPSSNLGENKKLEVFYNSLSKMFNPLDELTIHISPSSQTEHPFLHREPRLRLHSNVDSETTQYSGTAFERSEDTLTRLPREHNSYELDKNNRRDPNEYSLSEDKLKTLGSFDAVQNAHRNYLQSRDARIMANRHRQRMESEGKCHHPMKRVVNISNETSKIYNPRCTLLHRCGDDTGCCRGTNEVCTNKTAEVVSLFVFVSEGNRTTHAERIYMYNHTECHCVDRFTQGLPRDKRAHFASLLHRNSSCTCPSHFNPLGDQRSADFCYCGCIPSDEACVRLQSGLEGFSLKDQRCILRNSCEIPTCKHGHYNRNTGRCPNQTQYEEIG